MNLSEKLMELRKGRGLTQEQLAEEMNVSRQAISRWELGVAVPSLENLIKLCGLYGVPLDYLINDAATIQEPQSSKKIAPSFRVRRGTIALLIIIVILTMAMISSKHLSQKGGDVEDPISIDDLQKDDTMPTPENEFGFDWDD